MPTKAARKSPSTKLGKQLVALFDYAGSHVQRMELSCTHKYVLDHAKELGLDAEGKFAGIQILWQRDNLDVLRIRQLGLDRRTWLVDAVYPLRGALGKAMLADMKACAAVRARELILEEEAQKRECLLNKQAGARVRQLCKELAVA